MPRLTRWFIKTALVYLVLGLLFGVLASGPPALGFPSALSALRPVFFHLLVVGWLTQLVFGVAFWMFPPYLKGKPRGNERLAWASFALLNLGLVLRLVGEPLIVEIELVAGVLGQAGAVTVGRLAGWLLLVAASLQWLGALAYAGCIWGRVRAR